MIGQLTNWFGAMAVAQGIRGPDISNVDIIVPELPPPPEVSTLPTLAMALAVIVSATLCGFAAARLHRWCARDRARSAFRRLARRLRLTRRERGLIESLAISHGRAKPVALLLSGSTLMAVAATQRGMHDDPAFRRLAAKLGC